MRNKGGARRGDSGGHSVLDAGYGCSVTAAPFTRPVRSVFVTFDVSIKTRAVTPKTTPSRETDRHHDPCAPPGSAPPFTRDPALDSLCLSFCPPSPVLLTHTQTPEGLIVSGATLHESWGGKKRAMGTREEIQM